MAKRKHAKGRIVNGKPHMEVNGELVPIVEFVKEKVQPEIKKETKKEPAVEWASISLAEIKAVSVKKSVKEPWYKKLIRGVK